MNREYFVRGKRKTVEQIDDVLAIKLATSDRGVAADINRLGTRVAPEQVGMPEDSLAAFRGANWDFVVPSVDTTQRLGAREAIPQAEEVGVIVKRESGRFGIVTKRLTVQLREEITKDEANQVLAERGLVVVTPLTFAPNLFEVDTTFHADALSASVELHDDSRFTLAEPSFIEHVPPRLTPTDPRFGDQWQWANTGQGGGTAGADVSAEEAWDQTRGAGIRVAVIDNGFNPAHEDLQAGVVAASGAFTATGGTVTFTQGTAAILGGNHGTFCAGMVGARHNNGLGGCGAAPECELMLVVCLGDQVGTQTTLARAVAYAADPSRDRKSVV